MFGLRLIISGSVGLFVLRVGWLFGGCGAVRCLFWYLCLYGFALYFCLVYLWFGWRDD